MEEIYIVQSKTNRGESRGGLSGEESLDPGFQLLIRSVPFKGGPFFLFVILKRLFSTAYLIDANLLSARLMLLLPDEYFCFPLLLFLRTSLKRSQLLDIKGAVPRLKCSSIVEPPYSSMSPGITFIKGL